MRGSACLKTARGVGPGNLRLGRSDSGTEFHQAATGFGEKGSARTAVGVSRGRGYIHGITARGMFRRAVRLSAEGDDRLVGSNDDRSVTRFDRLEQSELGEGKGLEN